MALAAQKTQIESLFQLLDSVRGERANLKQQIAKLQRVKAAAIRLHFQNQKLQNWAYGLAICCMILATGLVIALFRR